MVPAQVDQDEEPNGFGKVRHLENDQKHLRLLLHEIELNKNGKKTKIIKDVLEEALYFLDTRERFWASQ